MTTPISDQAAGLLNALPEPAMLLQADGTIVIANRKFSHLTGYGKDDLADRSLQNLAESPKEKLTEYLRRCSRTRQMLFGALNLRNKTGETLDLRCEGTLFEPASDGSAALLLLRFKMKEAAAVRFSILTEKIDELNHEIAVRKEAEQKRELYRLLVQHSRDIMLFFRPDGAVIDANEAALKAYGYSRDELLSLSIFDIRSASTRDELPQQIERVEKGSFRFETVHRRKDGTDFPVEVSWSTVSLGSEQAILSLARDITERKQAETALKESERRFRATFENAAVGIAHLGPDGNWLRVNERLCEITGYPREELLERTFADITHPEDIEADWAQARRLLDGEIESYSMEKRYIRKDGAVIPVMLTASVVRKDDGSPGYFIGVVDDITERRRSEEKLREQYDLTRSITDNADTAIFLMDLEGRTTFMNPAAERMTGYSFSDVEGLVLHDQVHHTRPDGTGFPMQECPIGRRVLHRKALRDHEDVFVRKDGTFFHVRCSASPIVQDGVQTGIVLEVQDITERKQAESAIRESEARYRLVNLATNDVIWDLDLTSGELIWNEALRTAFGHDPAKVPRTITWWYDHLHPEDRDRVVRGFHAAIDGGGATWQDEYRFLRSDGSYATVLDRGYVNHQDGTPVRMIGSMIDLTERLAAEEARRESDERFRLLADNINQLAWMADETGWIFWYNRRWYEYTGSNFEEMQGWGWRSVHHPDHVEAVTSKFRSHIERGEVWEDTFPLRSKDGTFGWFLSRAVPVRDDEGRVTRWFGTNTDITERMLAEEERRALLERERAARHEAESANRAKDEFLAVLSHELRTPLNSMKGWTSLLENERLDPEQSKKAFTVIARGIDAQHRLIEDILDVSRIISGKLTLEKELCSLPDIIERAVEAVRPTAEKGSISLTFEVSGDRLQMNGDPPRLEQIVGNLLTNAIKFTPPGGKVVVTLGRHGSNARMSVADTGIGISPDFLPRVFERFQQADSTTRREHGGLGLGLAIVRHLVELHGGTIRAESEGPGKGAVFTVDLPLAGPEAKSRESKFHANEPAGRAEFDGILSGLRILVVEDDADSSELLRIALESHGAVVTTADDAPSALSSIDAADFDLLVSDLGLPGTDGFELIREVRQTLGRSPKTLPAVALSGYTSADDRTRALSGGFQLHIAKPVDVSTFPQLIRSLLNGR